MAPARSRLLEGLQPPPLYPASPQFPQHTWEEVQGHRGKGDMREAGKGAPILSALFPGSSPAVGMRAEGSASQTHIDTGSQTTTVPRPTCVLGTKEPNVGWSKFPLPGAFDLKCFNLLIYERDAAFHFLGAGYLKRQKSRMIGVGA